MTDSRSATTSASDFIIGTVPLCAETASKSKTQNSRIYSMREFLLSFGAKFWGICRKGVSMEYRTIAQPCEARFIEKKSEFIGWLCPVETEEQALAFIERIRAQHRKATHNCYAYILRENNTARHSDDGEPGGTAGVPIYEVLRKEGLSDVCCVVTRYFGGILLGAGGLVRAYTRAAKDAADAAQVKLMAYAKRVEISVDYGLYGRLPQVLAEFEALTEREDFGEGVTLTVCIRAERAQALAERLTDVCCGKADIRVTEELWYDFAKK